MRPVTGRKGCGCPTGRMGAGGVEGVDGDAVPPLEVKLVAEIPLGPFGVGATD
jgi:hypothetical protein